MPVALADGESQKYKSGHCRKLGPCGEILQDRAPAQSDDVDPGHSDDGNQRDDMSASDNDSYGGEDDVFLEIAGTIPPRPAADATERAAMVPPLATLNSIHP